ncbi:MAG: hypothetical protein WCS55_07815 [Sulfuricurvum sp.]|uniref:rolling circle replication-associated protein n=1 Tax=Sulfuricurvum sp. TaxID=2025608 RepID=UPI0035629F31
MKTYSLSSHDLKYCRNKIDSQKSYLSNNHFHTGTGQVKSLLDVSFSANISERYYSQLSNKINTMSDLAFSQNLSPVFLTITLDGFFRGFVSGNFSKWNRKKEDFKNDYLRHIPNNEVYGFLHEKIKNEVCFTIKDCYNVLAYQWYRYSSGYAFKKLKKEDKQFIYLKAAEPHQDGIPHFHVLLWIPEGYFDLFKKDFCRYFPAPRNSKEITEKDKEFFKRKKRYPIKGVDFNEGDTYGFQTLIHNPVGYIMKYATKSFMDLRTGEELNYLQAWYIKHKIRRITTSHSTIPQWVYQKVFAIEKDWYHLTDLTIRAPILCEWNKEEDHFTLIEENGRSLEYDCGVLTLRYIDGPLLKQIGERKEKSSFQSQIQSVPAKWKKQHERIKSCEVYIDGQKHVFRNKPSQYKYDLRVYENEYIAKKYFFFVEKEAVKLIPQPLKMSNIELYNYWQNIDSENVNSHHYLHTYNEMVKRDLLEGEGVCLDFSHIHNAFEDQSLSIQSMKQWKEDINYVPFDVPNPWEDNYEI